MSHVISSELILLIRYNKRPEDFKSSAEYNDYLEELEDIIQERIQGLYTDSALKEYENIHRNETKHNSAFIVGFLTIVDINNCRIMKRRK